MRALLHFDFSAESCGKRNFGCDETSNLRTAHFSLSLEATSPPMQARKRTNSTTDAAPAPKAAAANPPTIPTPVPAAAVEATKTADDSLPVNAPPSMRAAVSVFATAFSRCLANSFQKWRLSAPYEVATESTWKAYVGFRTKVRPLNVRSSVPVLIKRSV